MDLSSGFLVCKMRIIIIYIIQGKHEEGETQRHRAQYRKWKSQVSLPSGSPGQQEPRVVGKCGLGPDFECQAKRYGLHLKNDWMYLKVILCRSKDTDKSILQ